MIISVPTMSMNAVIIRTTSLPMSLLRVATKGRWVAYEGSVGRRAQDAAPFNLAAGPNHGPT